MLSDYFNGKAHGIISEGKASGFIAAIKGKLNQIISSCEFNNKLNGN